MTNAADDVVERLRGVRDPAWLRLIDEAAQVSVTPDPDVVEPYRWFLARLGDGVALTAAGYLPPAVVQETMQALGWDVDWIGAANREDLTVPVADLRHSARLLGLTRVHRGTLLPTTLGRRFAEDPIGLWQHIAGKLPLGRSDVEQDGGVLWLLATAAGRQDPDELVARGLGLLGWAGRDGWRSPDSRDVHVVVRRTRTVFDRLGLLGSWRRSREPLPDAARTLARTAVFRDEAPRTGRPADAAPMRAPGDAALELTVTLQDVEPPVWRQVVVPASLTLRELHAVLQTTLGWQDAHLFLFRVGEVLYGDVEDFPGEVGDDTTTTVGDAAAVGPEFGYEYDFGDGWEHVIRVGQRLPAVGVLTPHCTAGARACPPEDCGGPPGYEHLLHVLADGSHPDHAEMTAWVGGGFDPEAFDVAATSELLALYDRHTRGRRRG
ncbi:plasmid pRiA4b ORF-3 family protein [Blastococcus saxobsidens]|uniref:PRiA4b ORF-3-like protein n=1 Tax=Blastococcus saxobsidens TaxID=138336 RepID=A0A4Q7Y6Y4_9ACTN|nr:plasmid pRiA4b ORF-3 family protein [Blastococcus saxobsidens]RZU32458.1 pRiA4b ORF-3-like protein [Blastococcus saxobsidens]